MDKTRQVEEKKARKPWTKPVLRHLKLTEDEIAELRASEDPKALLIKLKPAIEARNRDGK